MKFFIILFLIQSSFLFGGNKKKIEIVFLSMPARSKLMLDSVVEKYNLANPKVKITARVEHHDMVKKVSEEIEGGKGPDGFIISDVLVKSAIYNNWIQPIDKYLTLEEILEKSKYVPKSFVIDGKKYGYHTGSRGSALFYNKKILEKYDIPKPKHPSEIPHLAKLAKDNGIVPLVNDTKYSTLKYGALDYLTKYHLYMEEQKLFVFSKDIGYNNKYEAFFSGEVAFIVGSIEDVDHSDFYRNIYGMVPLLSDKVDIKENIFTLAYVLGKNTKHPKETMDFFRYLNRATSEYNNYFKSIM
ncbi:ABC transporter substrate-binding protein [Cetobacterium sp. SF1]|uniref:ABC transporter substrate-binding protein n=1 Tax=Cetobacterium sp. SF1 TaxID=3417654 RepID=UPI003CE9EA5C